MSADVVNLRRVRKAKARADRDLAAAENRRVHGRTKAERQAEALARDHAVRELDGHLRERDETDGRR